MLAVVAEVLLEAREWGSEDEVRVRQVWEAIEARIPRAEVRSAVATVTGMVPPPEAVPDGSWRAELAGKTAAVVGFCKMLTAGVVRAEEPARGVERPDLESGVAARRRAG